MRAFSLALGAALLLASASKAEASATFEVIEGVGLDDATPTAPVGGNPGRTLGAQRRNLVAHALSLWGRQLESRVPIRVYVTFTAMRCTETVATLGGARPASFFPLPDPARPGATLAYPSALADRIAERDLAPGEHDIYVELNASLDHAPCDARLGGLYYGFDGRGGAATDLLNVMLHELAHGLGITSQVDVETGEVGALGLDVFSAHIHDLALDRGWRDLDLTARSESLTHVRQLVFDGPATRRATSKVLARGTLGLTLTPSLPGFSGDVASAELPLGMTHAVRGPVQGVTGADLCGGGVRAYGGAVLLVDGAEVACSLTAALARAAQGGASAMLVTRQLPGLELPALPLSSALRDPAIPVLAVAPSDAVLLAHASTEGAMTATITLDPQGMTGADAQGRPFLFASVPAQPGSSISHFDPLVRPDLLMEPYSTASAKHDLDLTVALMRDLGWTTSCGNGRLDAGEACDAGEANGDTAGAPCRLSCVLPACGDGVVDVGESCDQGVANSDEESDACRTSCVLPTCGDGVIDRGEVCDGEIGCEAGCVPAPVALTPFPASRDEGPLGRDGTDGCSLSARDGTPSWTWLLLLGTLALRRRRTR